MSSETKQPLPERGVYYADIDKQNMSALWNVFHDIITPEPKSRVLPHLWRYSDVRSHLLVAGDLITAKEAERRVLILENPGMRGESKITNTLYAGVQLVLPGEVAPAHRHTQSALRFILEGEGAHTVVDGEKTYMNVGDFVITPSWGWHDHGNESSEPMIWLDGLDIPMISFFETSFTEGWPEDEHPLTKPVGDADARFGQGILPVDYQDRPLNSPMLKYPYERTREALEAMRRRDEWDEHLGLKVRYINPSTGDFAMPTIGACLQLLPGGFTAKNYRSTDATVYTVVEGSGQTTMGDTTFNWQPRDVFVVPSWTWVSHQAHADAVLFSYSDRPVQEKLGLFREARA